MNTEVAPLVCPMNALKPDVSAPCVFTERLKETFEQFLEQPQPTMKRETFFVFVESPDSRNIPIFVRESRNISQRVEQINF